jgi:Actin like proteins N terminal domain
MKLPENTEKFSVGIDIGNGNTKAKFSSETQDFDYIRFPSYVADITTNNNYVQAKSRVDFIQSSNLEINQKFQGKSWVTGSDAAQFDIKEQVFDNRQDGKVLLALPLLLSAISQLPIQRDCWDLKIVASVHDAEVFGQGLKYALQGLHQCKIMGTITLVNIEILKVYDEGLCFSPAGKTGTTVLDLGAGTTILTRFDKDGNVISREHPHRFGVQHLLQLINNHPSVRALGTDRDIDLIRQGVECSDGATVKYGQGTRAVDVTIAYRECLREWVEKYLRAVVQKAEQNHVKKLHEIATGVIQNEQVIELKSKVTKSRKAA